LTTSSPAAHYPGMLAEELRDAQAWVRDSVSARDWLVPLPEACRDELDQLVEALRTHPLPVLLLQPEQFPLRACTELMATVRTKLREGIGLAVIDRVPVARYTLEENRALWWLLGSLLGRTVAQKWDGTIIYDVRDTGRALEYGVRRSVTNLELQFHTDGPWLAHPPELVGLYCLSPALEGGVSRFLSLGTVHNELRRRHPELLPRLFQPFPWDRQAEHPPGEVKVAWRPIFSSDGQSLRARYNEALILSAEELTGERLDDEGRQALAAVRAIVESPELPLEFVIETGQMQYLNNWRLAHSRTPFRDAEEPGRQRHLIRLWHREEGRRSFHG
jgi:alpha-ketoglutarate-dependent taurine dioxygenase